jgi:hypothetical protein
VDIGFQLNGSLNRVKSDSCDQWQAIEENRKKK